MTVRDSIRGFKVPGGVLVSRPFRAIAPKVVPPMHRFVHRVSGGRTLLSSKAQPMLLLESVGAKTGQRRETPLAAVPRPDDCFVVVGSNFARPTHPAWTANLLARPDATITYEGRRRDVRARLLDDGEAEAIWPELLEWYPGWERYTDVTDRTFRVFELSPR